MARLPEVDAVARLGAEAGHYVRLTSALELPEKHAQDYLLRRMALYANSSTLPGGRAGSFIPRAEMLTTHETRATVAALALAHELGHCEQQATCANIEEVRAMVDANIRTAPYELDAWHRGLQFYAQAGLPFGEAEAEVVEAALLSYGASGDDIDALLGAM